MSCVRIVKPPPGATNAKFRGRVGVVQYPLAGDDEQVVVAVERRESEKIEDLREDRGLSAENLFEFLAVPKAWLEEAPGPAPSPEWVAPMRRKRQRRETQGPVGQAGVSHDAASRVAVVVPFRDLHAEQKRGAQLKQFVPHMGRLFGERDYRIIVVEQSDDGRKFNRGKLLNIGYRLAVQRGCDAFIFHDVDLLPGDDLRPWYAIRTAPGCPAHIARVWDRYSDNKDYFGGIASWNAMDFECINGFPNNYWGWGGEDDEMMRRCKTVWGDDFRMDAPLAGSITDLENMNLHAKLAFLKTHDEWKCNVRWELRDEHLATWESNGLRNGVDATPLQFTVLATTPLDDDVNGHRAFKITVDCALNGDWADAKSKQ